MNRKGDKVMDHIIIVGYCEGLVLSHQKALFFQAFNNIQRPLNLNILCMNEVHDLR